MLGSLPVLAAAIVSVTAHATFQEMWVNGVDQGNGQNRYVGGLVFITDVH